MLMALEFHIAYVPGDGPEQVEKEVVVVMIDDGERRTKNQTHVGVWQWSSCEHVDFAVHDSPLG